MNLSHARENEMFDFTNEFIRIIRGAVNERDSPGGNCFKVGRLPEFIEDGLDFMHFKESYLSP